MTMSARLALMFCVALLSACASRTPPPAKVVRAPIFAPTQNFSPAAEDVLFRALGLVGTPIAGAAILQIRDSIAVA